MKRWFNLLIIFFSVCTFSSRAQSEVYMDYDFADGALWQVGGFEVYDIMQRGEIVGEARIDYSELEMLNAPAYRLEWSQTWVGEDGETTGIEIDVKMRSSDLKALMSTYMMTIGNEEWRFEGNYTGQSLEFLGYYPGNTEPEEASLTRSGRFHDFDIFPFLLRNIPFEDGNFLTLTVVNVSTHSTVTPIPRVTGSEIVSTDNTQYDCWTVNWSLGGDSYTAWYSKNEKHYLVKIRYPDRELVLNHHS